MSLSTSLGLYFPPLHIGSMHPSTEIDNAVEINYDSTEAEYTVISAFRERVNRKKGTWKIHSVVVIDAIHNTEKLPENVPRGSTFGFMRSRSRAEDRHLSPAKMRGRHSALDRYRSFSRQPGGDKAPPVRESSVSVRRRCVDEEATITSREKSLEKPVHLGGSRRTRSFNFLPTMREASISVRRRRIDHETVSKIDENAPLAIRGARLITRTTLMKH